MRFLSRLFAPDRRDLTQVINDLALEYAKPPRQRRRGPLTRGKRRMVTLMSSDLQAGVPQFLRAVTANGNETFHGICAGLVANTLGPRTAGPLLDAVESPDTRISEYAADILSRIELAAIESSGAPALPPDVRRLRGLANALRRIEKRRQEAEDHLRDFETKYPLAGSIGIMLTSGPPPPGFEDKIRSIEDKHEKLSTRLKAERTLESRMLAQIAALGGPAATAE